MKERYRIVNKEHYVFVERNGQDYMYKIIRPEIQMRVFYFFWITIKKFIYYNKDFAAEQAQHILNELNKQYKYALSFPS